MTNINVRYEDMRREAAQLVAGKETIVSELTRLRGQIEGLVSSGFVTDHASVRFNDAYRQFTDGATQTIGALDDLSRYLHGAADTLQETDQALSAGI